MGVYIWNRLPSEYQEVEYIQSSGTQYIDTNLLVNGSFTTEVRYAKTSDIQYNALFGTRSGSYSRYLMRNEYYSSDNIKRFYVERSYSNSASFEYYYTDNAYNDNNTYTIKLNKYLYINNTLLKTFTTSDNNLLPYTLYLFAINKEGTPFNLGYHKLYYTKIRDDSNNLVRDFVPCYRKSDSVIGMYDLVNNQFYTNSGSGTFSKGNDVNTYRESSLKNAYIGEVYEYSYDFRNKTLSQIQADGFSVGEGTVKLNANGISSNTSNARIIVNHSIQSLNNAKSLTIIQNCILSSGSNSIRLNGTGRTYATGIYMDDTQNQQLLQIGGNNTTYSGISAGTYTQKLVINFESKIATLSCTGKSDQTKTITDTEINNIYNNITNIETYVYGSNCYIKDFSIVISY